MRTFGVASLVTLLFFVVLTLGSASQDAPHPTRNIIDSAVTINNDQLFMTMHDGSRKYAKLKDEQDAYEFTYHGEKYKLFYTTLCDDVYNESTCEHYILFDGRNIPAPNSDI